MIKVLSVDEVEEKIDEEKEQDIQKKVNVMLSRVKEDIKKGNRKSSFTIGVNTGGIPVHSFAYSLIEDIGIEATKNIFSNSGYKVSVQEEVHPEEGKQTVRLENLVLEW